MSYRKYTAAALRKKKTLAKGQTDNLKLETKDGHRYWLSRMTREDGAPFGTNGVTVEKRTRGGWKEIAIYDGSIRG